MWPGKGGRLSQCTALTWRNLWAKRQDLIGIWHFHRVSRHKVVAPPLIFPYGLYQINLVPQICNPEMSYVQKANCPCLNCLYLQSGIDHCVVTKVQPHLYSASPSQEFWNWYRCWNWSFSSLSLRASWNLYSILSLNTFYGTLALKSGTCTAEILTWIVWNVFPFSAMPTKTGHNQYNHMQADIE